MPNLSSSWSFSLPMRLISLQGLQPLHRHIERGVPMSVSVLCSAGISNEHGGPFRNAIHDDEDGVRVRVNAR